MMMTLSHTHFNGESNPSAGGAISPELTATTGWSTQLMIPTAGYGLSAAPTKLSSTLPLGLLLRQEYRFIAFILLVGALLTSVYFLLFYKPLYESSTDVYVKNIIKSPLVASLDAGPTVKTESGYSNPLFNFQQVWQSDLLAGKLWSLMDDELRADLRANDVATEEQFKRYFTKKLVSSSIIPSSDVLALSVLWPNQEHAPQVASLAVKAFKAVNLELQKEMTAPQEVRLNTQLKALSDKLTAIRRTIKNYKIAAGAVAVTEEGTDMTRVRVDLEQQLELLNGTEQSHSRRVAELKRQLQVGSPAQAIASVAVGDDPYLVSLQTQLATLRDQKGRLLAKFTEEYPDVQQVQGQISALEASIGKRKLESVGSASGTRGFYDKARTSLTYDLAKAQADLTATQGQKTAIVRGIATLKGKANALPAKEYELKELMKVESALALEYEALHSKQLEATLRDDSLIDNLMILSPASLGKLDVKGAIFELMGWLALFTVLATVGAWAKDALQNKWVTSDVLQEVTATPILACLQWDNKQLNRTSNKLRQQWLKLGQTLLSQTETSQGEAPLLGLFSTVTVRHQSQLMDNLAHAYSNLGKRPLVVEPISSDLGRLEQEGHYLNLGVLEPTLTQLNQALRDFPERAEQLAQSQINTWQRQIREYSADGRPLEGLVLSISHSPDSVSRLMASRGYAILLQALRQEVDVVLVNTPAAEPNDALATAIASYVDSGVVYVSPSSKRQHLVTLLNELKQLELPVLGLVTRQA
jgi:uncharacterized protein involved in exopolysaccharide biosynthesis